MKPIMWTRLSGIHSYAQRWASFPCLGSSVAWITSQTTGYLRRRWLRSDPSQGRVAMRGPDGRICWLVLCCSCLSLAQLLPATSVVPLLYTQGRIVSPAASGQPSWQLPLVFSWPGSSILTFWSGVKITVAIEGISYWQPEVGLLPANTLKECHEKSSRTWFDRQKIRQPRLQFRSTGWLSLCFSRWPIPHIPTPFLQLVLAYTISLSQS